MIAFLEVVPRDPPTTVSSWVQPVCRGAHPNAIMRPEPTIRVGSPDVIPNPVPERDPELPEKDPEPELDPGTPEPEPMPA